METISLQQTIEGFFYAFLYLAPLLLILWWFVTWLIRVAMRI